MNLAKHKPYLSVAPSRSAAEIGSLRCAVSLRISARFCPRPRRTPERTSESTGDNLRDHSRAAPALRCGIRLRHTALFEELGEPTWFAAHACVVGATAKSLIEFDDPCLHTYSFTKEQQV